MSGFLRSITRKNTEEEEEEQLRPFGSSFLSLLVVLTMFVFLVYLALRFLVFVEDKTEELERAGVFRLSGYADFEERHAADVGGYYGRRFWIGDAIHGTKSVHQVDLVLFVYGSGASATAELCTFLSHSTHRDLRAATCFGPEVFKGGLASAIDQAYRKSGSSGSDVNYRDDQYKRLQRVLDLHMAEARKAGRF